MIPAAATLLRELEAEVPATRRLLERVPGDRLGWRPHPKSMTLGQLANHIAGIPGRLCEMANQEGFDASEARFEPPAPESAEALTRTLDESVGTAREILSGMSEADAAASWTLTHGERKIFTMPRLGVVRTLALNHWYHHRGQLTVYLRLLDVPVPVVYGRTADESPFEPN